MIRNNLDKIIKSLKETSKTGEERLRIDLSYKNTMIDRLNPYDENLSKEQKEMILEECKRNFIFFLDKIVKIPMPNENIVNFHFSTPILEISNYYNNNRKNNIVCSHTRMSHINTLLSILKIYNNIFRDEINIVQLLPNSNQISANYKREKYILNLLPSYIKDNYKEMECDNIIVNNNTNQSSLILKIKEKEKKKNISRIYIYSSLSRINYSLINKLNNIPTIINISPILLTNNDNMHLYKETYKYCMNLIRWNILLDEEEEYKIYDHQKCMYFEFNALDYMNDREIKSLESLLYKNDSKTIKSEIYGKWI